LVVDDEPRSVNSLRQILQAQGYRVECAVGGAEAIERVRGQAYDVIFLDLMMPGVSGRDVLAQVTQTKQDTVVIILSGTDSVKEATEALRWGAQDFLRKPYTVEELIICLRRALWILNLKREQAQMQARVQESERLHRFLVNNSPDLIFALDREGRILFANHQFEHLLGIPLHSLKGTPFLELVAESERAGARKYLRQTPGWSVRRHTFELHLVKRPSDTETDRGRLVPFELTVSTTLDAHNGEAIGIYGVARDLTARRLAEDRIRRLAYFDPLTNLPNRQLFSERMRHALQRAQRHGLLVALLFLDLDQFKYVNDTLGHQIGDRLLAEVGKRLSGLMRAEDSVARMGGDEFTVILEQLNASDDARLVAQKVLDAVSQPMMIDDHALQVSASIGVSLFPDDGQDEETLVKNADVAMYRAKAQGRNNFQFYSADQSALLHHRLGLQRRLFNAIRQDQFTLFYQPLYNLQSEQLVGAEALVRWLDPDEGLILPERFLGLAEESGLILKLGEWVLNTACQQARSWQDMGHACGRISVNVSVKQLLAMDIVTTVEDALASSGLDARALDLEITESVLLEPRRASLRVLERLRELGVTLSIDDFGTGYSSLSLLKHLPIDRLKIDRSFVRDVPSDKNGKAIIRAILAMGESLEIGVTAEGLENEAQREFLRTEGCHEAQGFLLREPVPENDMGALLLAS
jgi:diguanylate cyclase (GGDEF)-like protein/PAS domain S-box-containing protein